MQPAVGAKSGEARWRKMAEPRPGTTGAVFHARMPIVFAPEFFVAGLVGQADLAVVGGGSRIIAPGVGGGDGFQGDRAGGGAEAVGAVEEAQQGEAAGGGGAVAFLLVGGDAGAAAGGA